MDNAPQIKSYSQSLELVVTFLRGIAQNHGALKNWCKDHDLDYLTIIKLKNGSMKYYLPQQIEKLLDLMGYDVSRSRNYLEDGSEDIYTIRKRKT